MAWVPIGKTAFLEAGKQDVAKVVLLDNTALLQSGHGHNSGRPSCSPGKHRPLLVRERKEKRGMTGCQGSS